jgi:hypothetical protein
MVGRERVGRDRGQAAVELALALPVVVAVTLGLVQVLAVAADQLAVELAARRAAVPLDPLGVSATTAAGRVTVTVTYTSRTDVPLIGALIGDVELRADVTMAVEPP